MPRALGGELGFYLIRRLQLLLCSSSDINPGSNHQVDPPPEDYSVFRVVLFFPFFSLVRLKRVFHAYLLIYPAEEP